MFVRQSVLIATAYLALGIVVVFTAYIGYLGYSSWNSPQIRSRSWEDPDRGGSRLREAGQLQNAYAPALLARANQRLTQLQVMLDKTSEMLRQKTELLNQRTSECRALQQELDETLSVLIDAIAADSQLRSASPNPPGAKTPAGSSKMSTATLQLEAELESLREDMSKADFLEAEQATELEQLKQELNQMEMEVQSVLQQTQTELDVLAAEKEALAAERQLLAQVATQSLLKVGANAVPALTDLLLDERAVVRAWAASALGEMGATAQEASPALGSLLRDPSADVRDAAQRALAKITPAKSP